MKTDLHSLCVGEIQMCVPPPTTSDQLYHICICFKKPIVCQTFQCATTGSLSSKSPGKRGSSNPEKTPALNTDSACLEQEAVKKWVRDVLQFRNKGETELEESLGFLKGKTPKRLQL